MTGLLEIVPIVGKILDRVLPDKGARDAAKLALMELDQRGELEEMKTSAGVITAEIQGESWLQRSWRPLMMLWFGALVGAYWFGYTPENLSEERIGDLFTLVQIGIGGYVAGRSFEKIADTIAPALAKR